MTTTYTPTFRFPIMQPGDLSVANQWGNILNTFIGLLENAVGQPTTVTLSGSAYTLTANDNAADEARYALINFEGSLTSACTVTIPAEPRVGWAQNMTSGGYDVVLTTGVSGGSTLTIEPGTAVVYWSDGTNVYSVAPLAFSGNLNANSIQISGNNIGYYKIFLFSAMVAGNYSSTVPSGCYHLRVRVWGAGGGGGGTSNQAAGGGGGSGGYTECIVPVSPGDSISITVGAGGSGGIGGPSGAGTNGASGGASSVSVAGYTITANGGGGGMAANTNGAGGGGGAAAPGGSSSGLSAFFQGGYFGGNGIILYNNDAIAGQGAGAFAGGPPPPVQGGASPISGAYGLRPGGGGNGGVWGGGGGNGADGGVLIEAL
jgi:hypothetical protein